MMRFAKHILIGCFLVVGVITTVNAQRVAEQPTRVVQCYPNPANTVINFEFNKTTEKNLTLSVFNFIGKRVDEIRVTNSRVVINLDQYFRGLYFYQLKNREGRVLESGKFQVVK